MLSVRSIEYLPLVAYEMSAFGERGVDWGLLLTTGDPRMDPAGYLASAVERAMKVQEVILRAIASSSSL
jgi:hypothetical protein